MPWLTALRTMWVSGSAIASSRLLSRSVSWPLITNSTSLAALLGHVAHHARKAAEQLFDRHHADFHDRTLQIVEHARLEAMASANLPRSSFFGIAAGEFVQRLLQHGFADDQFAHQVEHVVDASGLDAQDVFQSVGAIGADRSAAPLTSVSARLRFRRLSIGIACGQAPSGCSGAGYGAGAAASSNSIVDFFHDGRNFCLGGDLFGVSAAGQNELDLLVACRGFWIRARCAITRPMVPRAL